MASKINKVLTEWPRGAVVPQPWLSARGVDRTQAHKYEKSEWIHRVGHGVWQRYGDSPGWLGAVYGLQQVDNAPRFWPGGGTALGLLGYSHYLPMGKEQVTLFGDPGAQLPKWFAERDWGVSVSFQAPALFEPQDVPSLQLHQPAREAFELWISTPERALFELLHSTPDALLFEAPAEVFAGMASLRPGKVQALLEACRSVKLKRVFLLLARYYNHAWYRRLDPSKVDLGKGKRQLYPGGRLDKQFLITVPERFADGP
jgi:hypothetical protein